MGKRGTSSCEDALSSKKTLHQIRDNGLAEPNDSPHRMENIWTLIPETLEGVDLESVGYHRYLPTIHPEPKQTEAAQHTNTINLKGTLIASQNSPLHWK